MFWGQSSRVGTRVPLDLNVYGVNLMTQQTQADNAPGKTYGEVAYVGMLTLFLSEGSS